MLLPEVLPRKEADSRIMAEHRRTAHAISKMEGQKSFTLS